VSARRPQAEPTADSDALRLLSRRPLTVFELRQRLERRGHAPAAVEGACSRMRDAGYLDDRRLALDFIVTRAARLGHGPERMIEALCARGIDRGIADSALQAAVTSGDLSPCEVLRRRIARAVRGATPPLERREYARVYNALRRAGFDEESIRQELEPFQAPAPPADSTADEATDDFA